MNSDYKTNIQPKGFSLVELMIAVGAMAGIALVVMQISKNSASTQVVAFNTSDFISLKAKIETMMLNDFDCKASLKDITFKATQLKSTPLNVELWNGDQVGARKSKFISGTDSNFKKFGKIAISSVQILMPDFSGASDFPAGIDQKFKIRLTIEGEKSVMGKSTNFQPIEKELNIIFDTDSTGLSKIKNCGVTANNSGGLGLGVGQTWQKMTSRSFGTTYTNSTVDPIVVNIYTIITGDSGGYFYAQIDSQGPIPLSHWNKAGGGYPAVGHIIVPAGATYSINYSVTWGASPSLVDWYELR
jgi:prepilin-type N-terminal cleavage/methylation domain-containing protein